MMAMTKKKAKARSSRRRLGRGLTSLISAPVEIEAGPPVADQSPSETIIEVVRGGPPTADPGRVEIPAETDQIVKLSPDQVFPRSGQPRQTFDEGSLIRLAESIRTAGMMQPILVRPATCGYEIIAGERRWRAAKSLGLASIPTIIRELDDERCAEWSLIENLQREDLNPIDRAEAFQRLIDEFGLTHQNVADRVALDRSSISNHIRLNELDSECKEMVRRGGLSMGHARALLGIANHSDRLVLASRCERAAWSVRELERRVKAGREKVRSSSASVPGGHPQLEDLQKRLGEHLGTKVRIATGRKKGSGKLIIEFYDFDQFDGLLRAIQFDPD